MAVFMLPDRRRELVAAEGALRLIMDAKLAALEASRTSGVAARGIQHSPAFMPWLIAHRRWLHANEKLARLRVSTPI